MPHHGDYTVASLRENLQSIRDHMEAFTEAQFELYRKIRPWNFDGQSDAHMGLWKELEALDTALDGCLTRLKTPPKAEAKTAVIQRSPPILDSCKAFVDTLHASSLDSISLEAILELKVKALWFNRTISNGASWTDTQNGLLFYMSLLPADPPRDFQALGAPAAQIHRWRSQRRDSDQSKVNADTVSYWLTLLNADFNDREPEEYYREKIFMKLRDQAIPDYSKAAVEWPRYAGQFWTALRPQIFSLFNNSRSSNFVQWCLEFARGIYPEYFGTQATNAQPILDLIDGLCSGAISPLHIACAMGLPKLCHDLLSSGSDINRPGPLGTPLWCSLVGCGVFEYRCDDRYEFPAESATYGNQDRVKTILLLLDAGADCRFRYHTQKGEEISMMGPAYWAALATQNDAILRLVMAGGAKLDEEASASLFLCNSQVDRFHSQHRDVSSRLFTYLFDLYLKEDVTLSKGEVEHFQSVMKDSGLTFACADGEGKIEGISDEDLDNLTNAIMSLDWVFGLRRLVLDPRFDPNRTCDEFAEGDSLLHTAVAADCLDMVDVLLSAGADLHAQGENGRTPVMCIESTTMLDKLVFQYGAVTRDIDETGRNLWHYAAATEDEKLLTWLCEKDPWKHDNMRAVSDKGRTPLAEAFFSIEVLVDASHDEPGEPYAARKLLREWDDDYTLMSPVPLTHLAAAWGDLELINGLEALGADFRQRDQDGRTVLHYLNFSASTEVVERLQKHSAGLCVESDQGLTPAETIFLNIRPMFDDDGSGFSGQIALSGHPSCKQTLSEDAYSLLLNAATMGFVDYRKRCFWQRFCENIIGSGRPDRTRFLPLLQKSLTVALKCIIRAGGLEDYERETGEAAVMCFWKLDANGDPWFAAQKGRSWNAKHFGPFIQTVLENCGSEHLQEFYSSEAAIELMCEAIRARNLGLLRTLCSGISMSALGTGIQRNFERPLKQAIAFHAGREVFGELLKHITSEELTKWSHSLHLELLGVRSTREQVEMLEMLLQKGMDPNYVPPESKQENRGFTLLEKSAAGPDVAQLLLKYGANPRAGDVGSNAAIAAAQFQDKVTLLAIIRQVGADFPWTAVCPPDPYAKISAYRDASPYQEENILTIAASEPEPEILEILFEHTNLDAHINDVVGGGTAAHRAAARGCLENLRLLVRHGADLTIRDVHGRPPVFIACSTRLVDNSSALTDPVQITHQVQCVAFLAEKEPRAAMMKDDEDRTAFDYAAEQTEPVFLRTLKQYTGMLQGEEPVETDTKSQ